MVNVAPSVLAVLRRGVVDPGEPIAAADDAGLTRGDGCFEGCRVVDGVVDKLDAHLARMTRSAAALDIEFDEPGWRELVDEALHAWTQPGEAVMKLLLTRGQIGGRPTGYVSIGALPSVYARQRSEGISVITLARGYPSDAFADAPWLLGGVKTLSYAINMAAAREAESRGADDVIFVSSDGFVLETPTGTVVWAVGRTLHTTPTGATGILGGTTTQRLFERAAGAGWQTQDTLARPAELHAADAVWVVSSGRGPVQVIDLDGTKREIDRPADADIRRLAGF